MAITKILLACDHCGEESADDYEDEKDVQQSGWLILRGADWMLGCDEKVYCGFDCMHRDLYE